jgi:fumarate reductase flavoprotein subunit
MDAPLLELGRSFPDFVSAEAAGAVKTCADAAALATLIGADSATVAAACASAPKRPLQAPFYAVKVTGALFHTQGGLDIDDHCRVLHADGTPFPNLLAAGGAARGVSGNAVWGYMSGNGLLSAVGGGAVAAATVVEMLQS